jgi:hypothetical protein
MLNNVCPGKGNDIYIEQPETVWKGRRKTPLFSLEKLGILVYSVEAFVEYWKWKINEGSSD